MSRIEMEPRPTNGDAPIDAQGDGRRDAGAVAREWRPRERGTSVKGGSARGVRRLVIIGAVIVVAVGAIAGIVLARRSSSAHAVATHSARPATRPTKSAMAGMPGMQQSADGSVSVSPAQLADLGVTFGTAAVRPMHTELRATGVVTANETRLASVTPRFGGYVERLYANVTGAHVRRGDPLAAVYSPDVLAAEQELLVARGVDRAEAGALPGVGAAPDLTTSARRRLELWGVSSAQIAQVLRTGRAAATVTLYAAASGVITEKRVVEGQAIQAGMPLYTITDLSDVWIDTEVRQADAQLAHVGASATIEMAGYPGAPFEGRVSYVYPTADDTTRSLRARITVPNPGERLKPGMLATVRLTSPSGSALTVPRSAVVQTGTRTLVFVDLGGGRLAPRDVVLGRVSGDLAEIVSGLGAGTRVVTSAQFLLDSESNLAEVMQGMIGAPASGGR